MSPEQLVVFAEELSRIAASGGGAKALAAHLARSAGVGVLVEDAEWRNVATAGPVAAPTARALLDPTPDGRGFQRLRNGYSGRTIAIVAGETHLGQLTVFGENDLDEAAFATRLTAAAIAVALSSEMGARPGRRRVFWERLASGGYTDAVAARDDASSRGIVLSAYYVAVVTEAERGGSSFDAQALRALISSAFKGSEADVGMIERGSALSILVPAPREVDGANARTAATLLPRTIAKTDSEIRITGGVGSRAALLEVPDSIAEAEAALTITRRLRGPGSVGVYDDLGAYALLLRGGDAAQMREFATRILAPLRAYDEKHQTDLERTLRLYFSVGENVKTAAAELSVHRHTVFYRLRQIGEICRCNLANAHDQLTLRMAIAIDALTG